MQSEPIFPYSDDEEFAAYERLVENEEALEHIGKPHEGAVPHSGRYAWGSGESPYQRSVDFISHYNALQKAGWTDKEIAKADGLTISQLRARKSNSNADIRHHNVAVARKLKEAGWSTSAIGRKFGVRESTVRGWFDEQVQKNKDASANTANMLADQGKQYKFVEVGKGIEQYLGVSGTKLGYSLDMLEQSGRYRVQDIYLDQGGKNKKTRMQVLVDADTPTKEIYANKDKIAIPNLGVYTENGGDTWEKVEVPKSVDMSRVYVNYTSKDMQRGGVLKDGVIEIRPGVQDLSLGKAQYAQVRIRVGEDKYMKGMAVYSDKVPKGYDIIYNTNKTEAQAAKVFKTMNKDRDGNLDLVNPFGATIKTDDYSANPDLILCQRHYIDKKTGKRELSAINVVNEEGNWKDWGRTLSAQMLSKQQPFLAKRQLKMMYDRKVDEFNEILGLTNPTIRAHLLEGFADDCDASAVHLKAAAIPGSASHVIIPILTMKENEIYAPNYENGSRVALIRYPHGGRFEIADLTVNNLNQEARKVLGVDAPDAVGIHPSVAAKLSGADFDGDTVTVIPNDSGDIKSSPSLKGLMNYEPKVLYAKSDDQIKTGKPKHGEPMFDPKTGKQLYDNFDTQQQMGIVSNLITDMTIKKASTAEICRAVRHSMTVIDAEKHNLDWKQSYEDNRIEELKKKYQGVNDKGQLLGASTLISRAKSEYRMDEVKKGKWVVDPVTHKGHRQYVDPETGEALYSETGRTYQKPVLGKVSNASGSPLENAYYEKDGNSYKRSKDTTIQPDKTYYYVKGLKELKYQTTTTKMGHAKDAYELSSGTDMESIYADHANRLKRLANEARKEMVHTEDIPYSPAAAKRYADEVASLNAKYKEAVKHKPLERRAVALMTSLFQMKLEDDPTLEFDKDRKKKERARLLEYARKQMGESRPLVKFSAKEYEAIQAGAIRKSFLKDLIKECDLDSLKQQAMPRQWKGLSPTKLSRARQMIRNGATTVEVAQAMGVSTTTLYNALNGIEAV